MTETYKCTKHIGNRGRERVEQSRAPMSAREMSLSPVVFTQTPKRNTHTHRCRAKRDTKSQFAYVFRVLLDFSCYRLHSHHDKNYTKDAINGLMQKKNRNQNNSTIYTHKMARRAKQKKYTSKRKGPSTFRKTHY